MAVNILWFKRDLRLNDHAPLQAAIATGKPLLLLYCFEPSLLTEPHYDLRHWRFVTQCLADLNRRLPAQQSSASGSVLALVPQRPAEWLPFIFDDELLPPDAEPDLATLAGGVPQVHVFQRELPDLLAELHSAVGIATIFSHEETGLRITYDRDQAVAAFCRQNGIAWREFQSNGVIRPLTNREQWRDRWGQTMQTPQAAPDWPRWQPAALPPGWYTGQRGPDLPADWHMPNAQFQPGGEVNAHRYLHSFLTERIALYARSISKPQASRRGCSRLSPYLAWGCLSIRQVVQAQQQAARSSALPGVGRQWLAFASRLRWHCHFVQKFESEDRIEFENVNRAFDVLPKNVNLSHLRAWTAGQTGYPLVDACMRCLAATGYINFRMRAMLTSFLTHHLLQDWKAGAVHLARLYTDFEPGIHYAQTQMQAGMTGTNTVRIYNPVKQAQDHDPDGAFVRQWVPELQSCPAAYIFEPWTIPPLEQEMAGFWPGQTYPLPIIDIAVTGRVARLKLHQPRKTELGQAEKDRILTRHSIPNADDRPRRSRTGKAAAKPKQAAPKPVPADDIVQQIGPA
jgi:deoxyribodipyrimidine photo-lyase